MPLARLNISGMMARDMRERAGQVDRDVAVPFSIGIRGRPEACRARRQHSTSMRPAHAEHLCDGRVDRFFRGDVNGDGDSTVLGRIERGDHGLGLGFVDVEGADMRRPGRAMNCCAIASPMPDPAPVTTTTLSRSEGDIGVCLSETVRSVGEERVQAVRVNA